MISLPAIVLAEDGSIAFWEAVSSEQSCSLYAFINGYFEGLSIYDSSGQLWRVTNARPLKPVGRLRRVLARILYNPQISVFLEFSAPVQFALDQLKSKLFEAIDRDDDILAQFVEAEFLKTQLQEATSVSEIVRELKKSIAV